MVDEQKIKVICMNKANEEVKRKYAKAFARNLLAQYGKEICEKLLVNIKNSK